MSTALKTGDVAAAATRKRSFLRKASRASVGEEDEIAEEEDDGGEAQGKKPTVWKRLYGYMRFSWALVESLMVSMTSWLDKFSKDYRHVSKCLTKERSAIKVSIIINTVFYVMGRSLVISWLLYRSRTACRRHHPRRILMKAGTICKPLST